MIRLIGAHLGGLLIALAFGSAALAAVDESQAKQDWQQLEALVTQHQKQFLSHYDLEKRGRAYVDEWKAWKEKFQRFMGEFRQRYGSNVEDVATAFKSILRPLDVQQDIRPLFQTAADIDIAAKEKYLADGAVSLGRQVYSRWKNFDPEPTKVELQLDYAERALWYFRLAKELDPEGNYDEFIQQAQQAVEQTQPEWEKALKEMKWPGHNADFEGPGSRDDLAEAALEFLRKNPNWSKPEYDDEHRPVAACVTGKTWEVYKKTVLGEPTQYSIDILVAFAGKKDPKIAYCYHMVFYTREEAGVAKSPPFHFANSRQYAKYRMLMANVPAGTASSGPTSGLLGWLLRIILSLSLLVGGLVASESMIRGRLPQVGGMLDALVRHRATLGILLLLVGVLGLLRTTLLFFSPIADLLPQAAAIVLGLLLAKEMILGKTATTASQTEPPSTDEPVEGPPTPSGAEESASAEGAAEAAPQKLSSLVGVFEQLERTAVPLGLLGLALGLLHLLLGGWSLF